MKYLIPLAVLFTMILLSLVIMVGIIQQRMNNQSNSFVTNPDVIEAITIDIAATQRLNVQRLLNGNGAVLVLDRSLLPMEQTPPAIQQAEVAQAAFSARALIYVFNGLSSLEQFDINQDGVISSSDDVFPALELVTFKANQLAGRVSLNKAGVRAIILNKEYLKLEKIGDNARYTLNAANVVMADSSTRIAKILPLSIYNFGDTPALSAIMPSHKILGFKQHVL